MSSIAATEERVRRAFTWWRVPLMLAAFLVLLAYLHDLRAFWWGSVLAILGQAVQTWAGSHLHKDTKFTISGPYSHVRNPMYIGRFFLMLGFVIMTWEPWVVVVFVVLYAAYAHMRVNREEDRLCVIFAPDYQHYCGEIRRWLPRLRPYSKSESRRASWSCVQENHEEIHFVGLLIALGLIYARITCVPWHWPQ